MKFHRSRFKPQVRKILVVILILAITPIFCQSKKAKTKTSNKKTPSTRTSTDSDDWCYDSASCGPGRWGGVCNSGKRQSPINIPTAKVTTATAVNTRIIVNRNYAIPKSFFVKNTGKKRVHKIFRKTNCNILSPFLRSHATSINKQR